ncbi:MAG: hypothetical protein HC771_12220 [Synechococcales cyanobacterium CRU_2_2]|nr:hypothetical protein [Synechococcales cyanobacterium CRU_2_2]
MVGAPSPGASLSLSLDVPAMAEIKTRISNASESKTSVKAFIRYRRRGE